MDLAIFFIVFFAVTILVALISDSLLLGIIVSVLLAVLFFSWDNIVKRFKERNINKSFVIKCIALIIGIIVSCTVIFYACSDDPPHKCVNCGKKGNYYLGIAIAAIKTQKMPSKILIIIIHINLKESCITHYLILNNQ